MWHWAVAAAAAMGNGAYADHNNYQECYCCTCDPTGQYDPACRLHGSHGTRECSIHTFPGVVCPDAEETGCGFGTIEAVSAFKIDN